MLLFLCMPACVACGCSALAMLPSCEWLTGTCDVTVKKVSSETNAMIVLSGSQVRYKSVY